MVKLAGATNAYIDDGIGTCTIIDNDGLPELLIGDINVVEGNGGTTPATFQVGLSAPSAQTVTVDFSAVDGTGPNAATVADGDFPAVSGTITFPPGSVTQTAAVPVFGDTKPEGNETFHIQFTKTVNALASYEPSNVVTIVNDDGPTIIATSYKLGAETCKPANGSFDLGEAVTVYLYLRNIGSVDAVDVTATLLNQDGILVFNGGGPVSFGTLPANGSAHGLGISFKVDQPHQGPLELTFAIKVNGVVMPSITVPAIQARRELLRENFDELVAPALPPNWSRQVTSAVNTDPTWRASSLSAHDLPNAAFAPGQAHVTDNILTSPAFPVTSSYALLTFSNSYNLEEGFDGAVLEISYDNGPFADIFTAGGSSNFGRYKKTISPNFGSPIAGRFAWSGNSSGFIPASVTLPAAAAGKSVRLRWRVATDSSGNPAGGGQVIDKVSVTETADPCGSLTVKGMSFSGTTNVPLSGQAVATFFNGGGSTLAADYTATIVWGDGVFAAPATVTANENGGGFTVTGDHTYASPGTKTTTINVQETGGNLGSGQGLATVAPEPPPTPTPTPTPTAAPTATPSPSSTALPSATPFPTATPAPGASPQLVNISTRLPIGTGENVLIAGFIITGNEPKRLIARAIGPSSSVAGALANPTLELYDSDGLSIASNDNWQENANAQEIIDSGIPPTNILEPAILTTLNPGLYTTVVRGIADTTGVGVAEVYDLSTAANSKLVNISTRGLVQPGDNAMIAGLYVIGESPLTVAIRALAPSLPQSNTLENPTLELFNGNGDSIGFNDDWWSVQQAEIFGIGLVPPDQREAVLVIALDPGPYTAVVRDGAGGTGTGVALVEVYALN